MHSKRHVYADNAATTRLDPLALEAMLPFLRESYGNPSSLYSFGKSARKAVETAREQIAECVGARPQEILFTSGGTESDNWAIKGAAWANRDRGTHLITSAIEHSAVLNSCAALEREGFLITRLPVDEQGTVSTTELEDSITPRTVLVSVMLANNEIGTIQDIPDLADAARRRGAMFHTDAVQAVGHIPINVSDLGVDLLSASAHKFNGPKGVGFLCRRNGVVVPPYIDGGHQEGGSRSGTENVAGIVGMACALTNRVASLPDTMSSLCEMNDLIAELVGQAVPEARFSGHPTRRLPGLTSLSIPDISAESLLHLLDLRGISVSTGAACNAGSTVVSHVLRAIGLPDAHAGGTIRVSFGIDNTLDDARSVADGIAALWTRL
ncbi:MAG: cysteine desulfurase [Victivallales bacterium]|nr:cysteine desulfurase [Verrucomicrobiota bacterium]MBT7300139.1 cysteine desulfurase [Victivallales bacterium]